MGVHGAQVLDDAVGSVAGGAGNAAAERRRGSGPAAKVSASRPRRCLVRAHRRRAKPGQGAAVAAAFFRGQPVGGHDGGGAEPSAGRSGEAAAGAFARGRGISGLGSFFPNGGVWRGRAPESDIMSDSLRAWKSSKPNCTASWPTRAGRRGSGTACVPPTRQRASFAICAATWAVSPAVSTPRIASKCQAALSWRASKPMPEQFSMTRSTLTPTLNRNG